MEATVNLKSVQAAICQLRERRERVSRRNVRAITGGGMSTVHRLMNEVEELERLKTVSSMAISENLHNAILAEIGLQVQMATSNLQEDIRHLQEKEAEALEALADVEISKESLAEELKSKAELASRLQRKIETVQAISDDTVSRLDRTVSDLQVERTALTESIESMKIQVARSELQVTMAKQDVERAQNEAQKHLADLQKQHKTHAETQKKVAAAVQKAADLRGALVKAEKRIKTLEQSILQKIESH